MATTLLHVGMGKTGTTSLQRAVFAKIPELNLNISYNPKEIRQTIHRAHRVGMSEINVKPLREFLFLNDTIISDENLLNWNPHFWEKAADINLKLFGPDINVLLTMRDTEQYLKSYYQQKIHKGNIMQPEEFFLSATEYRRSLKTNSRNVTRIFDLESLDYNKLAQIYRSRFKNVYFLHMDDIPKLEFLGVFHDIPDSAVTYLRRQIASTPSYNRSYSKLAMSLTFKRARLISTLGFSVIGSDEYVEKYPLPYRYSGTKEKLERFPSLIWRWLSRGLPWLRWRWLMQNIVDKIFRYEPYRLPKTIKFPDDLLHRNNQFLNKIKSN